MPYKTIQYAVADGVATITLNRPDKLNAVTSEMIDELIAAADAADADDAVRVVLVTGAGRAFCAGADLSRGASTFDRNDRPETGPHAGRDGGGRVTLRIYDSKKPWIGAINGPAVGFGMTMQLAFDLRLASETARFGMVFTRRAVVMEACSSWFLSRAVGMAQAQEWVLTGRVFDADEALRGGLVRSVHAPGDLLPAARALAQEIAANTAAVSVAYNRNLLWKMAGADHPMEAHKLDSRGMRALGAMPDAKEGVSSFLEKRAPNFTDSAATDMPPYYPWWRQRVFE
ncbi:MAG: crotonase/enoyl-CoA hydratase family protein [Alphaproteobacteria bacterium]|nr:crotonase/enoyl-CoA hydratase family protein [Alphaproteobacteria bacterium]